MSETIELLPVQVQQWSEELTVQTVDARALHEFLGSKQDFSTWLKARIEQYGFIEGQDYLLHKIVEQLPSGAKTKIECRLSLSMAKELCMVERNARGKEARKYFLECERRAQQASNVHFMVPQDLPAALRLAADLAEKNARLASEVEKLEPKAEFHDHVAVAINCHTVEETAKILGTGRNRFFEWLRERKILMDGNRPYQRFIEQGYFRVIERQFNDARGESRIYVKTLITGKGITWLQRQWCSQIPLLGAAQ